jgi:primosomal protein N' (replication factor Y)
LVTSIPSIETYNNIINKKYQTTKMNKRYKQASLPKIEIINLHSETLNKGSWIANKTINKVDQYLNKGDQVLFFLNRRGYAPFVICKKCGYKFQCPNCTINLNFHKKLNRLLCHYCGHKSSLSRICKDNKKCDLLFCGPGVERIFLELKKIYPRKKIEIFSSDTLEKNKLTNTLLKKVEKKKIDILVGTQLLSKGFHFPKLNCIVVVDADFSSHGYDLRSAEKNIQLYHQLSGRAGREGNFSNIFFQTYTPDDEILLNISKNDPHEFLQKELSLRKNKKLPPFYRLVSLIISGKSEDLIMKFAINIKSKIPKINEVNVLGPVLAPIIKLKKKYRCRILIRYPKNLFIQKYLSQTLNKIKVVPGIKLEVDVDPINFS